tara:strand:- start:658 stop:1098 length:441 start_codon:yes stop_codon:yes gene_type:complete
MAYKMTGKSPMMKKLLGKQHNLPAELKAKIIAAPESPAKMYDKSPAKKYKSDAQRKAIHASKAEKASPGKMYGKSPMKQKVDKTMEEEAAREDKKMKEIAIKRGYMLEMVENPDGTRKTIKVPVDKNGKKIKSPAKNYKKGYYGVK